MNEKETRPNILFAFADDWGRYASAYRPHEDDNSINHLIETPNFDRIANEGALFTNAFVPAPSCTPCRSSVLSGRYFWQTGLGAILQGAHWDESIPSYPLILEHLQELVWVVSQYSTFYINPLITKLGIELHHPH